jgi:hypothetical protein
VWWCGAWLLKDRTDRLATRLSLPSFVASFAGASQVRWIRPLIGKCGWRCWGADSKGNVFRHVVSGNPSRVRTPSTSVGSTWTKTLPISADGKRFPTGRQAIPLPSPHRDPPLSQELRKAQNLTVSDPRNVPESFATSIVDMTLISGSSVAATFGMRRRSRDDIRSEPRETLFVTSRVVLTIDAAERLLGGLTEMLSRTRQIPGATALAQDKTRVQDKMRSRPLSVKRPLL